jgi:hypothetical protein
VRRFFHGHFQAMPRGQWHKLLRQAMLFIYETIFLLLTDPEEFTIVIYVLKFIVNKLEL